MSGRDREAPGNTEHFPRQVGQSAYGTLEMDREAVTPVHEDVPAEE